MSQGPLMSRAAVIGLSLVGGLSLAVTVVAMLMGDEWLDVDSAGNDTFSSSAIGHRAFFELLRELDMPVVARRELRSVPEGDYLLVLSEPLGDRSLLVLGEDDEGSDTTDDEWLEVLEKRLEYEGPILLVLPKWHFDVDWNDRGWVTRVWARPKRQLEELLSLTGIEGSVVRLESAPAWATPTSKPPVIPRPQLVSSIDLTPIVDSDEGVLFGYVQRAGRAPIYLLSDPDLIANHGIGRSENATLAVHAVREAIPEGHSIVFDETIHGHGIERSFFGQLLRFPLVLVVLQTLSAASILLWAGMKRFGAPAQVRLGLALGKDTLIENTALLLRTGGHLRPMLERYFNENVRRVSDAIHLPAQLEADERLKRLHEIGTARGVEVDIRKLKVWLDELGDENKGRGAAVMHLAQRIHAWREDMLHGRRTTA